MNDDPEKTTAIDEEIISRSPGLILRDARESQSLTENDIALALNLPIYVITSIEADRAVGTRSSVFTRGYIRSYARLMDLDGDPLVDLYDEKNSVKVGLSLSAVGSRNMGTIGSTGAEKHSGRQIKWILSLITLLIILMIGLWAGRNFVEESTGPTLGESDSKEVITIEEKEKSPSQTNDLDNANLSTFPKEKVFTVPEHRDNKGPIDIQSSMHGLKSNELIASDTLFFSFVEDCWVEIQDGSGELIYGDLRRAGSTLEVSGIPPLRVLLGYAHGVSLMHNGSRVALAPHTRNNVASFVLGI